MSSFPKRAVHLDFHTMPGVFDIGERFSPVHFAETLKAAHVEAVTIFARCNLGFAYYPTEIGIPYPDLKFDLLGEMLKACHAEGIQGIAYFNVSLDHEHAHLHREWCKVAKDGVVYDFKKMGHFFRKMCLNTDYGNYLYDMIREVLERYPVDGIFLDCFNLSPCYGSECIEGMKACSLEPTNDHDASRYCCDITESFRQRVIGLVEGTGRDLKLCFNGLTFRKQPTHIELEILPLGGTGYDALPWQIRYVRTLGKPYMTMTGRFQGAWGDFGGLRPEHSLLFDCCNSIANGGSCSVGDHLHPRGELDPAVYRTISNVFGTLQCLDSFVAGTRALADVAVLHPRIEHFPGDYDEHIFSLMGAARMLSELKVQFDVCDGLGELSSYQVIILPDDVTLSPALEEKLEAHLRRGGVLISSAKAGLDPTGSCYSLSPFREAGIEYLGEQISHPCFFTGRREIAEGIPDMPIALYQKGVALRAGPKALVLADLQDSYFELGKWDGRHEYLYAPPKDSTGAPAVVAYGPVIHLSFPVFRGYFDKAVVSYKHLIRNCINRLFPQPLIRTEGLPSFAQVTVTGNDIRRLVHLLTYVPELRGRQAQIIEEPISVRDVVIHLRLDGFLPQKAILARSGQELPYRVECGYAIVTVPVVNGYEVIVFE